MSIFRSKCTTCGQIARIFPDEVGSIKKNSTLALYPYCKDKLEVGSDWFCCSCHDKQKPATHCKIISEINDEEAKKMLDIRARKNNLEKAGWVLPQM